MSWCYTNICLYWGIFIEKYTHKCSMIFTFNYKIINHLAINFLTKIIHFMSLRLTCFCKVEFNQPSYWLYSVPNLLVFQQLVTLYLGGILVRVVSEILWRNTQECARKTETRDWISRVTHGYKPPEAAHMPGMPEVEASC